MRSEIAGFQCIVENPGQSNAVLMFHGFGADYSDLAPLAEVLDPEGYYTWIFPNGPKEVDIGYHMTGRAWFPISVAELNESMMTGGTREYADKQPPDFDAVIGELTFFMEEVKREYEGFVLGGFSQGGMVASHLLSAAGDSLLGGLFLSTVLLNQNKLEKSLEGVSPKKFFQCHGTRDPVLGLKQAQQLYQFLKGKGWKGSWLDFPGGHEIPMPALVKATAFLKDLQE